MWIDLIEEDLGQRLEVKSFEGPIIRVGREHPGSVCQLIFKQEKWPMVSRRHAEFHLTEGRILLLDTDSAFGTLLNGNPIERPTEVCAGDRVQFGLDGPVVIINRIGDGRADSARTPLAVGSTAAYANKESRVTEEIQTGRLANDNLSQKIELISGNCATHTRVGGATGADKAQAESKPVPDQARDEQQHIEEEAVLQKPLEEITTSLDATASLNCAETAAMNTTKRLNLFYELPLQFGTETQLDSLLQLIIDSVVDVIAEAKRGALLVKDHKTGRLTLKAHIPIGDPAISMTMAEQAIEQRKAFVWPPPEPDSQIPSSVIEYHIESAMYAPLLWREQSFGVVCVDNCENSRAFKTEDLQLLQAVAHHAAMAVANLQLQEEWRCQAEIQSNILKLVSPQLADRLKQQRGRLRLGGEFRDATILISDIRGFTNLSATMSPQDVTEMIEDYFSRLVPIVFKYHGTIDKFVGDAILAVFGSPNPDEQQHPHAIKAAFEMQTAMSEVNARRTSENKRTGELGIGIHCGEVVHGFIGTPDRMEFTVIGDTVNRASRYCDGAHGGEILISPEVHQWIWNLVVVERTNIITKHEGNFNAYRLKALKGHKQESGG